MKQLKNVFFSFSLIRKSLNHSLNYYGSRAFVLTFNTDILNIYLSNITLKYTDIYYQIYI